MKVLIAEDDVVNLKIVTGILTKGGYEVVAREDGALAFEAISQQNFDAVVTDWMMPNMDGIALITKIRETVHPAPPIIMLTGLNSNAAKEHALQSGADSFLGKPYQPKELLALVQNAILRANQAMPEVPTLTQDPTVEPIQVVNTPAIAQQLPPMVCVCVTGNLASMMSLVSTLETIPPKVTYFMTLQSPPFLVNTFIQKIGQGSPLQCRQAEEGLQIVDGNLYLCMEDKHLSVDQNFMVHLDNSDPENYLRPSADPLFRSVALNFGPYAIGVVLGGMGRDGSLGIQAIAEQKGTILIQDPKTAMVPSMPKSAIAMGLVHHVIPIDQMVSAIHLHAERLTQHLEIEHNKLQSALRFS